jgi:hypothetical protein
MSQQEGRLPQVDAVTFAALNTLDNFIARAPLTRQEHGEASRCLQHLAQTLEMLQATLRNGSGVNHAAPGEDKPGAGNAGGRVGAEVAEEVFRKA